MWIVYGRLSMPYRPRSVDTCPILSDATRPGKANFLMSLRRDESGAKSERVRVSGFVFPSLSLHTFNDVAVVESGLFVKSKSTSCPLYQERVKDR